MNRFDPIKHHYYIDEVRAASITQMLHANGFYKDMDKIPPASLEAAREFGTAVHKACELNDKCIFIKAGTLDDRIIPYLEAWKDFIKKEDIILLEIERALYSKTFMLAGTPDRIASMYGEKTIIDIKTSHDISKAARFQLGGYKFLHDAVNKGSLITQRVIILLKPNGSYSKEVYRGREEVDIFKNCYSVLNARIKYLGEKLND